MRPIICDDTKTLAQIVNDFSNGLGVLGECLNARVTEEANGIYEASFDVPITAKHFSDLHVDGIVKLKANESDALQLFRIYRITKPLRGVCSVSLQHISYDLTKVAVTPFATVGAGATMTAIQNHMVGNYPFTFNTNISNTESRYVLNVPVSGRSCLGGREGSFIDVFGGELHWDNLAVTALMHRGNDRGVRIAYGKNLVDYRQEVNNSNTYNAVIGYAVRDDVTTTGDIQYATQTSSPKTMIVDFTNDFEMDEEITVAKLNAKAQSYISSHDIGTPNINIDVDFVRLWQSKEYKNIASLERVSLFDTVHVFIPKLNVEASAKVVKTVYDFVAERYTKIELGSVRANLGKVITDTVDKQLSESASNVYGKISSQIQAQIDRATAFLTGAEGGYQVTHYHADGTPYETLWMNTDSEATATNILRINANGLGFSNDGGATYRNAWLIDGTLSADFITTGDLNAQVITTGTIQDAAGNNYWNLDTGEFSLKALTNYSTTEEMSAAIKASADGISSTVSELSTKVDSNTEAISDNAKAISDNAAGLSSANTKITENSSAITQNANQISSVVSSVEKVIDSVDRANDAISRNSETISENTSKIEQASNQINLVVAQQGYSNLLLNSNFTDPANYFKYWSVFGYTGTSYVYDADFPDKRALQINKTNTTYGDLVIQEVNFNASLSKKYINLYLYAKITDPGTQGNTLSAAVRLDYSDGNSDFLGPSASETMTTGVLYKLRFSWLVSSDSVVTKITPGILYCDASHTQKAEINNCMMFISALDKPAPAGTWTDKGNNDLISQINLAPSGVKISGDKVNIETSQFTFGKDPSTVTMKTNSGSTGVSFEGSGTVDFNTKGKFQAVNINSSGGHAGSIINLQNDSSKGGRNYINIMNYRPNKTSGVSMHDNTYYAALANAIYITSNGTGSNTLRLQNYMYKGGDANRIDFESGESNLLYIANKMLNGKDANRIELSSGATGNAISIKNYNSSGNVRSALNMNLDGSLSISTNTGGKSEITFANNGNLNIFANNDLVLQTTTNITVWDGSEYRAGAGGKGQGAKSDNPTLKNWDGKNVLLHFTHGLFTGYDIVS